MTPIAAAAGAVVDALVGEPPARWHPVGRFGAAMGRVEQRLYADRRANGVAFTAAGTSIALATGLLLRRMLGPSLSTIVATSMCVAGKMLDAEATAIGQLLISGDEVGARRRLRSLVGRSTDDLDASQISRAVVESVAENCVDAVTASLFWGAVGGAPGVLAHRAINTLDAMVGHRDDRYGRFGWCSARVDDVANLVPARLTALAVAMARPRRAKRIWTTIRRDAPRHPSPNGGPVEAAFAAALDVQLGGVNRYGAAVEDRGTLGDGPKPTPSAIASAVRLRRQATAIVAGVLVVAASPGGRRGLNAARARPPRRGPCGAR